MNNNQTPQSTFDERLNDLPKTPHEWQEYRFNKCMDFWQRVADRYWGDQPAVTIKEVQGE